MAVELASGYVSVGGDTRQLSKDIRTAFGQASKDANSSGQAAGAAFGSKFGSGLKVAGVAGVTAAGAIAATAFTKGFNRLNAIDQAEAKLRGLKMPAQEVSSVMESVKNSVNGTAFALDEASGAAAMFATSGVKAGKDMDAMMKLTVDTAAQAGTSISEIAPIIQKAFSKGKLDMEVFDQLNERATGVGQALHEHLGIPMDQVRDKASSITFDDFAAAMEKKIGGAAQKTGETFKGSFDNMMTSFGKLGAELLKPVFDAAPPVFDKIKAGVNGVSAVAGPFMSSVVMPLASALVGALAGAFNVVVSAVSGVVGAISSVVNFFRNSQAATIALGTAVGLLAVAFAPVIANFVMVRGLIMAANAAMKTHMIVTKVATAVTKGFTIAQNLLKASLLTNPIFLIVAALVALVAGLVIAYKKSETFRNIVQAAWNGIKAAASAAWNFLKTVFGWLVDKFSNIGSIFSGAKDAIGGALSGAGDAIKGAFTGAFDWLKDAATGAWDGVKNAATATWDALKNGASAVKNWFASNWQTIVSIIGGPIGFVVVQIVKHWDTIKTHLLNFWNWLTSVFGAAISAVWSGIQAGLSILGTIFSAVWNGIKFVISTVWLGIQVVFQNFMAVMRAIGAVGMWLWANAIVPAWNGIKAAISFAWGLIKSVFSAFQAGIRLLGSVVTWLWQNIVQPAMSAIGSIISSIYNGVIQPVWNAFKAALEMVGNTATTIFDKIKSGWQTVGSIIQAGRDTIGSALESVKNFFVGLWNKVKEIVDKIKNAISSMGDAIGNAASFLSFGILATGGYVTNGVAVPMPAYASGGKVRGPGTGTSDSITAKLSNGEFVVNAKATKANFGLLAMINAGAPIQEKLIAQSKKRGGDPALPAFAEGGLVGYADVLKFLRGSIVGRSLQGAIYDWGGPKYAGSWGDCSGTQSMVSAFITGKGNPRSRHYFTGDQAAKLRQFGYTLGRPNGVLQNMHVVGWRNGGSGGGHTSGTVFGENERTNFEMGGGAGGNGKIGGAAAPWNDSYFNQYAWFRLGGGKPAEPVEPDMEMTEYTPGGVTAIEGGGSTSEKKEPFSAAKTTKELFGNWGKIAGESLWDIFMPSQLSSVDPVAIADRYTIKAEEDGQSSSATYGQVKSDAKDTGDERTKKYEADQAALKQQLDNKEISQEQYDERQKALKEKYDSDMATVKSQGTAIGAAVKDETTPTNGRGRDNYIADTVAATKSMKLPVNAAVIAVGTQLVESAIKMYANRAVPESLKYPHDAIGSDHDSVGLYQQRQAGWGTLAQRMSAFESTKLFLSAMVRKFPNWSEMDPGAVAQGVQQSAYPGRYATRMEEARKLLIGKFDRGGVVPPGISLVENKLRRYEQAAVFTPSQWETLQELPKGGAGVDARLVIEQLVVQDWREAQKELKRLGNRQQLRYSRSHTK